MEQSPKKTTKQSKRRRSTSNDADGLSTPNVKPTVREVKSTTAKSKRAPSPRKKKPTNAVAAAADTKMEIEKEKIETTTSTTTSTSTSTPKKKKTPKKVTPAKTKETTSKKEKKSEEKKKRRRSASKEDDIDDDTADATTTAAAPTKPTLDVQVHRLRHLDYKPSPVLCMTSCASNDGNLALAREDGSYELYEVSSVSSSEKGKNQKSPHMYPIAKIAGSPLVVAHSLCWVTITTSSSSNDDDDNDIDMNGDNDNESSSSKKKRSKQVCVAAGPDGTLWIVNFSQSQLQSRFSGGGGGVFDMVSCSSSRGDGANLPIVATACQDGAVRLWKVQSNGNQIDTTPIGTIPTVGAGVLSLAWGMVGKDKNKSNGTERYYETALFAGVADGTIRRYDLHLSETNNNGFWKVEKQTNAMRMTVESRGRRTATKIWTMQMITDDDDEHDNNKDITLVTGNSLGQVQFWNAQTGTLQQSITQTEYKADVLRIVVSKDQNKVFASGVDSRVICLERMKNHQYNNNNNNSGQYQQQDRTWKWTTAQRPHTHDVKAMAIVPATVADSKETTMETLVTSGVDTKLCSYVVSDFAKRRPQIWYPWPSVSSLISTSPATSILSMQRRDCIDLFQLDGTVTNDKNGNTTARDSSTPIGTVRIQTSKSTKSNIVASCLSPNGQWLALCNATTLFVFQLVVKRSDDDGDDGDIATIKPVKVHLPKNIQNLSVTAIRFHDNELFVADTSCKIHVLNLNQDSNDDEEEEEEELVSISAVLSIATTSNNDAGSASFPIDSIQISNNGSYVAAMRRNRHDCIHVFKRSTTSTSGSHSYMPHWTVPGLAGSRPAAMTLLQDDGQLAVATPKSHLYIFDLAKHKLNSWSENNGFPIQKEEWPSDLNDRKDYPVRLASNPSDPKQVIMSSFGAFCVINTREKMPEHCRMVPETHVRRKRRKTDQEGNNNKFTPLLQPDSFRPSDGARRKYRKDDQTVRNCTMCLNYNSMLYLDFMGPGKMVVVEQPWLRVISTFPEPLQRRVYGAN